MNKITEEKAIKEVLNICNTISTKEELVTFKGFVEKHFIGSKNTHLILHNSLTDETWSTTTYNKFITRKGCFGTKRKYRGFKNYNEAKKLKLDDVINEIKNLFPNKNWDFSKTVYKGVDFPMEIVYKEIDPLTKKEHGSFFISLSNLRAGKGCPRCSGNHKFSNEEFIERSRIIHQNSYTYEKTNYIGSLEKVIITCPIHGDFEIYPGNHLNHKQGCPKCSRSKGELEIIRFFKEKDIEYICQYEISSDLIQNCPNISKVFIDFNLIFDERSIYIEYNGKQHYEACNLFHPNGISDLEKQIQRDNSIREYAKANNIEFLEIPWVDINRIPEILEAFLYRQEDITTKIDIDYDNIQT